MQCFCAMEVWYKRWPDMKPYKAAGLAAGKDPKWSCWPFLPAVEVLSGSLQACTESHPLQYPSEDYEQLRSFLPKQSSRTVSSVESVLSCSKQELWPSLPDMSFPAQSPSILHCNSDIILLLNWSHTKFVLTLGLEGSMWYDWQMKRILKLKGLEDNNIANQMAIPHGENIQHYNVHINVNIHNSKKVDSKALALA